VLLGERGGARCCVNIINIIIKTVRLYLPI
jgi:hypothetical protein